jgi:hypothetical protein
MGEFEPTERHARRSRGQELQRPPYLVRVAKKGPSALRANADGLPRAASRWRIKLRSIRSSARKPQQSATLESEVAALPLVLAASSSRGRAPFLWQGCSSALDKDPSEIASCAAAERETLSRLAEEVGCERACCPLFSIRMTSVTSPSANGGRSTIRSRWIFTRTS